MTDDDDHRTDPLHGDGRRARSARSRSLIIDAAGAAFVEHGYVGTTIEAIAERAGLSVQTVYATFGNKPALFTAVLDATIVGDHDRIPLIERDWVSTLESLTDRDRAAAHLGAGVTRVLARTAPIYSVLAQAAADPGLASILRENRRRRRHDVAGLVAILARNRLLAEHLTARTGADVLFAIASEDVYLLLTGDCGWTRPRFERWTVDTIKRLLLRPGEIHHL